MPHSRFDILYNYRRRFIKWYKKVSHKYMVLTSNVVRVWGRLGDRDIILECHMSGVAGMEYWNNGSMEVWNDGMLE